MSVNQAAQQLLEIVQNQRIRGEEPGTQGPKRVLIFPTAALRYIHDTSSHTHAHPTTPTTTTNEARVRVFALYFFLSFFKSILT